MLLFVSSGILCMVCVEKETNACFHMTWQTASHPPSANTIRRAVAPMELVAGKNLETSPNCYAELIMIRNSDPSFGTWVLMWGKLKFKSSMTTL